MNMVKLLVKLNKRVERYEAFKSLNAPETIINFELNLIDECLVELGYTKVERVRYLNELIEN